MAKRAKAVYLLLSAQFIVLLPALTTPYSGDDIWMSTLKQWNAFTKINPVEFVFLQTSRLFELGRIPIFSHLIQLLASYLLDDRLLFKLALILLNVCLTFFIFRLINLIVLRRSHIVVLITLFFIAMSQLRDFYDPRTEAGILLISALFLVLAFFQLIQIMTLPKVESRLYFNFFLYSLFASLSYEVSLFVILLPALFVIMNQIKLKQIKLFSSCFWFLFSPILLSSVYVYAHLNAEAHLGDTKVNFKIPLVLRTLQLQIFGSFPATNFNGYRVSHLTLEALCLTVFILVLVGSSLALMRDSSRNQKSLANQFLGIRLRNLIGLMSISLIGVPGILVALSERFQQEVLPGKPYVSSLLIQIGFTLLLCYFLGFPKSKKRWTAPVVALFAICAFLLTITISSNFWLARNYPDNLYSPTINQKFLGWDRSMIEDFAKKDVFSFFDENSKYTFDPRFAWTSLPYLSEISGRKLNIVGSPDWWENKAALNNVQCIELDCSGTFVVKAYGFNYQRGFITLIPIKDNDISTSSQFNDEMFIYYSNISQSEIIGNLNEFLKANDRKGTLESLIPGKLLRISFPEAIDLNSVIYSLR